MTPPPPPDYSHPYIMDITAFNDKLEGTHPDFADGPIPTPKLKEISREFVRLLAHCDDARDLCSHNLKQIIDGGTVLPYPDISVPTS